MRAVIERNKNSELCSRVEQSAFLRIFAHSMDIRAIGNAVYNRIPTFPQVRRFKNVRLEVVEFMPIHGDIGSVGVVRRGIDWLAVVQSGIFWVAFDQFCPSIVFAWVSSLAFPGQGGSFFYCQSADVNTVL